MRHWSVRSQCTAGLCLVVAVSLLALGLTGCGGKGNGSTDSAGKSGESSSKGTGQRNAQRGEDGGDVAAGSGHRGVWIKNGQKYYNKHPYDIWLPNAYQVAADQRPVGSAGNGTGKTVAVVPSKKSGTKAVTQKTAPQSGGGWKSIVSGADLEEEMKRIANFCNEKLLMVARYNVSFKDIRNNAAALSAVAQVAAVHPDAISWKADALYLRDLGLKLNETATERGTSKYRAAKEIFEKIDGILKKNKPAGLPEPKKDATFFDVASRGGLMRRMEAAHKWLKGEVKTDEQFKAKSQSVSHEAAMLALMAKVIGDKSYDSAEDAAYAKYVALTVEEAQKIASASKAGSFAAYSPSVDKIYNQCNECHNSFRQ